ncbi:nuclear transport factor 2 family protein [Sporomusa sp.]|uniref:nuclear transport factor 2 family protein n=1 Tax=Sporomusa sp. TaxID=2078658 RepID=UPI002C53DAD4|nr:nuclear transport factor 2 family protein [Sporomusa sp.]HWR09066.1 nuclear transport factor 2 family protein [Sporomusa sp.]
MNMKLPPLVAKFVQAKNAYDSTAFVACFADQAVVHDEGKEMRGTIAIQKWIEASNKKYQDTLTVTNLVEHNNETVLTALVAGNFEGSPVSLDFHFSIKEDKIDRLSILVAGE